MKIPSIRVTDNLILLLPREAVLKRGVSWAALESELLSTEEQTQVCTEWYQPEWSYRHHYGLPQRKLHHWKGTSTFMVYFPCSPGLSVFNKRSCYNHSQQKQGGWWEDILVGNAEITDSVLIRHQNDDSNFSPSSSLLNQNWQVGVRRLFHPCINLEPDSHLSAFQAAGQVLTSTLSPKPPQNCSSLVQHKYPGTWSRESLLTSSFSITVLSLNT